MAPSWPLGTPAILVGLKAKPELNGEAVVVILQPTPTNERIGIEISATGKTISVKPENLQRCPSPATAAAADEAVEELERLALEAAEPESTESSIVVEVSGTRYATTEAELTKIPGSFFEALLRQRDTMSSQSDGNADLCIRERNGPLFKHVLSFLRNWPTHGELVSPTLTDEERVELVEEADFYLLLPLVWLLGNAPPDWYRLRAVDARIRQHEDSLRWLFANQRDAPELADLHVGLSVVYTGAARSLDMDLSPIKSGYPVLFDAIGETSVQAGRIHTEESLVFDSFERSYPGLLSALRQSNGDTDSCSWFVAGGSVLRSMFSQPQAQSLFVNSDVDIFVYARGENGVEEATALARRIAICLGTRRHMAPSRTFPTMERFTRTLFTLNLEGPFEVQIILRVYHSPAEVLCGFDIDCCCLGFGADERVRALPRALQALRTRQTILNPLHAWPRQPSYELRLAKYAARGFKVAATGLLTPPRAFAELQWRKMTRLRLINLRGAARLMHMDMALGLPEQRMKTHRSGNTRGGFGDHGGGYRGPEGLPSQAAELRSHQGDFAGHRGRNLTHAAADWQAAMHRTFAVDMGEYLVKPPHVTRDDWAGGTEDWNLLEESVCVPALPTEMEQIKALIHDPYGWVQDYFNYRADDDEEAPAPEDMPDPYKKLVSAEVTESGADEAWAKIADCGTDELHIPRRLRWSTLPRSREYMNMETPYSELCDAYKASLFDPRATDDSRAEEDSEYGESFLERYKAMQHLNIPGLRHAER